MENTKCMKIELEEREITVIRFRRKSSAMKSCRTCAATARHLTVSEAALLLRISERGVFNLVENAHVHFNETETGALLICLQSLVDLFKRLKNAPA